MPKRAREETTTTDVFDVLMASKGGLAWAGAGCGLPHGMMLREQLHVIDDRYMARVRRGAPALFEIADVFDQLATSFSFSVHRTAGDACSVTYTLAGPNAKVWIGLIQQQFAPHRVVVDGNVVTVRPRASQSARLLRLFRRVCRVAIRDYFSARMKWADYFRYRCFPDKAKRFGYDFYSGLRPLDPEDNGGEPDTKVDEPKEVTADYLCLRCATPLADQYYKILCVLFDGADPYTGGECDILMTRDGPDTTLEVLLRPTSDGEPPKRRKIRMR